jgi:hypothetical protein
MHLIIHSSHLDRFRFNGYSKIKCEEKEKVHFLYVVEQSFDIPCRRGGCIWHVPQRGQGALLL